MIVVLISIDIKWKELDWEWVEVTPSSEVVVVAFLAGPLFFQKYHDPPKKEVVWLFWVKQLP